MVIDDVFSVIAEGTRRDILEALAQEQKAVGQLVDELGVSQPTVSKHLRVLREAGVVTMRAQGQKRFYSLQTAPLAQVALWLEGLGAGSATLAKSQNGHKPAAIAGSARPSELQNGSAAASSPSGSTTTGAPARIAVPAASLPATPGRPSSASPRPESAPAATRPGGPIRQSQVPAVVRPDDHENSMPQQITRSVGRAANKAADLLANLPTFRRRKD